MGRLLQALHAELESSPVAKPANLAPSVPAKFADSQDSQRPAASQLARLLAALRAQGLPDNWLGLDHGDEKILAALTERQMAGYVAMLAETGLRERGKVPADDTAHALCRHCGPVWISPDVAAVAPTVNGWPRVLGCPWCHVHNHEVIPRPPHADEGA